MTPAEIADAYEDIGATLARQAEAAILRHKIITPAHVMQSLIPPKREVARSNTPADDDRKTMFGSDAGAMDKPQHKARIPSWDLTDLIDRKSGVSGTSVPVSVDLGGRRTIKKKKKPRNASK